MMGNHRTRTFLTGFLENLQRAPIQLDATPMRACWLDARRRLNTCTLNEHAFQSSLIRISIDRAEAPSQGGPEAQWTGGGPLRPQWRFELTCHEEELAPASGWLAAVVNRREGLLDQLPPPPFTLLNWNDAHGLDDYLCYLGSVSIWSERAFREDLRWMRQQATQIVRHGRLLTMAPAH